MDVVHARQLRYAILGGESLELRSQAVAPAALEMRNDAERFVRGSDVVGFAVVERERECLLREVLRAFDVARLPGEVCAGTRQSAFLGEIRGLDFGREQRRGHIGPV